MCFLGHRLHGSFHIEAKKQMNEKRNRENKSRVVPLCTQQKGVNFNMLNLQNSPTKCCCFIYTFFSLSIFFAYSFTFVGTGAHIRMHALEERKLEQMSFSRIRFAPPHCERNGCDEFMVASISPVHFSSGEWLPFGQCVSLCVFGGISNWGSCSARKFSI